MTTELDYTELDEYVDALAELLDEQIPLEDAYEQIADKIIEEDITFDSVIVRFSNVFQATTEEYAENLLADDQWAIENELVGVRFEHDDAEIAILDREHDS